MVDADITPEEFQPKAASFANVLGVAAAVSKDYVTVSQVSADSIKYRNVSSNSASAIIPLTC